jgi:cytochrome o ubiquinol oxidase subunit 2
MALAVAVGAAFASGCSPVGILDVEPRGPVESRELTLIVLTFGSMLIVLIPVLLMTVGFAWRYRASNTQAVYAPEWASSSRVEWAVWLIPALIVLVLSILTWTYTHRLDPTKPIDPGVAPLRVQVIALDWKWLFIYPDQGVAVVNQLAMPVDRPVAFELTSATVMNSFFIPQLGGQIYAMAGMKTQLHLLADQPGTYYGENTQYSGRGFPYQHFEVLALSQQKFGGWLEKVRESPILLDPARFTEIERPSIRHPVTYYSSIAPGLFDQVIARFQP